jgi:exonuclease III
MTTLSWNGRGIGQAATVQELVCLVQTYKPSLVFICETRQSKDRVENLRYRIGMKHCYQVSGDGKGGGIALYWTEDVTVDFLSFSKRHIDVHVSGGPYDHMWRATFVYGEPKPGDRHLMWTKLRQIKDNSSKPWLMMGDFNEAMWQEEHFSCTPRSERLMMDFREVLSHCDLYDIGFVGNPWTFDNKQKGDRNVRVRLDRAVASTEWSRMFPDHRLRHIASSRSDHCPILLSIETATNCRCDRPVRRYEIVWEREPSLPAAVEEAWSRRVPCNDLGDVSSSLRLMMSSLYSWKHTKFKSIPKEIEKKRELLDNLRQFNDAESVLKRVGLEKEMDELLYREEIFWMQRSRIAWLREGDKNTKYFHRRASWRKKKNNIRKLKRSDGTWTSDTVEMENMARDFFQDLYAKDENINPDIITGLLDRCITDNMNADLCAPFSEKEISDALFQIGPRA